MDSQLFSAINELASIQLSVFFNNIRSNTTKTKYHDHINPDITQKNLDTALSNFYDFVDSCEDKSVIRFRQLISAFDLSENSEKLLIFCIAKLINPVTDKMLAEISESYGQNFSIEVFFNIMNGATNTVNLLEYHQVYEEIKNLLVYKYEFIPYYKYCLMADERILMFLEGYDEIDKNLHNIAHYIDLDRLDSLYCRENLVNTATKYIKNQLDAKTEIPVIHVKGAKGNGKKLVLSYGCKNNNVPLLIVDITKLFSENKNVIRGLVRYIKREAILTGAVVGTEFSEINKDTLPIDIDEYKVELFNPLADENIKTAVISSNELKLASYFSNIILNINILKFSRSEQSLLWKKYKERYHVKFNIDENTLANRFNLSAYEIHKVISYLAVEENEGQTVDISLIAETCYKCMAPINHGNVKLVQSAYKLDDLKLPKEQKATLINICNHVIFRNKVFDNWEMDKKYAYGKGVSALFVGPPGTGKTMAANVLSSMLNLQLYRVDISQIVDKYIGETEKKLEEIFAIAENSNMILFFDEADAIFGKRSEVSEAKDRFANTETSYILQRIEDYDGIVILASNYKKNIDEAFMRRIRYLIEFQLPSPEIRKDIWMSCFTDKVPLDDIDFDYLANQFELSGGSIKNIVLNATFLAASQHKKVEMRHILESVKNENIKLSKVMLKQDFGAYGHIM